MSTPNEEMVASDATVERRFYSRSAPAGVAGISFGEDNAGMLLNVSENGLLVSTPQALVRDAVFPLSVELHGLPQPIEVIGRVVWTVDTNRAGLQLLNLRDHDREQIRAWAALGSADTTDSAEGAARENGRLAEVEGGVPKAAGRRMITRVSLAVGAGMAVVALAMGLSLRGSPMRAWLGRAAEAAAKDVTSVVGSEIRSGKPADAAAATAAVSAGVPEKMGRDAVVSSRVGDAKDAGATQDGGPTKDAGSTPDASDGKAAAPGKDSSGKKIRGKIDPPGDLKVAAAGPNGADGALPARNSKDRPPKSEQTAMNIPIPMGDSENAAAREAGAEDSKEGETSTSAPPSGDSMNAKGENAAQPEVAPKTSPVNTAPVNATSPVVIRMAGPKNEVVEVTLPNSPGATLLNLPGERVIRSTGVTMHVQRSVLVAGGQSWWSANRRKKVVLGELAERVDPQTPRMQSEGGGRVSVRAVIGKDGQIERVRPVSGSIALVPSVVRAIREWRYEPTLVDGKPVETGVLLVVEFHAASAASKP